MGKLEGKVAVVTGASRGIGQQIAELFASEGCPRRLPRCSQHVPQGEHLSARKARSPRTVDLIRKAGGEATPVARRHLRQGDCIALIEAVRAAYGPVDILVNNAALNYYIPTESYPTNRWLSVLPDQRPCAVHPVEGGAEGHGPQAERGRSSISAPARRSARVVVRMRIRSCAAALCTARRRRRWNVSRRGSRRRFRGIGGIAVSAVSPSQVVPTPGTIHFKLVTGNG